MSEKIFLFRRGAKKAKHEVVKYFKAFAMIYGIIIVISADLLPESYVVGKSLGATEKAKSRRNIKSTS
jgi:hypothetical protein